MIIVTVYNMASNIVDERMVEEENDVLPENRDVFNEIFNDPDSDDNFEFEGFSDQEDQDLEEIVNPNDPLHDANWVQGSVQPSAISFTAQSGITPGILPEGPVSFLQFFELLVTDDVFRTMAEETNRYARLHLASHVLKPFSRFHQWTDTSPGEMRVFSGLIIAMGLVKLPSLSDYWSTDPVVDMPFFRSVMSRNRFYLLMSFFHLADNSLAVARGQPGYSPLQKLGVPFQSVVDNFRLVYTPTKNIAIDEGMIPWRGNLHFRVYSPDKPMKYGMRVYLLCDSSNAYCCKLEMYTGKSTTPPSAFGLTYDLVLRLMQGYLGKGYHLYVDNYYTSPQLFYELFLQSTRACGTMRVNRKGTPKALKNATIPLGTILTMNQGTMNAMKFHDRKVVTFLTTIHKGMLFKGITLLR
jgi:hypothetical protein